MGRLSAFSFITLNGFVAGPQGDIGWHRHGPEENAYALEGLKSGSTLLFGRVTYALMASYWPSPMAAKNDPVVAAGMNDADKIVFSRTLTRVEWSNTRLVTGDLPGEVKKLKQVPGREMTLLGSGSIVTQLAEHGLIDEYQIMLDPVVLGSGTPLFKDLRGKLDLKLTATRSFNSGVVLLSYAPADKP